MFFFFSNYFQYLDFKNWNKKLSQVMQLQRKIYGDQLKMCYFCDCVKPQKKQLSDITAEDRLAQWLPRGFSAGPNETGISEPGRSEEEELTWCRAEGLVHEYQHILVLLHTAQGNGSQCNSEKEGRSTRLLPNPATPEVTAVWPVL